MLTDKGFEIGTDMAQKSHMISAKLLKWIEKNEKAAADFSRSILRSVHECCTHPTPVSYCTFKERMWEKLCSSKEFKIQWNSFLGTSIGSHGCPILYEFITKVMLEKVIKFRLPVNSSATETVTASH